MDEGGQVVRGSDIATAGTSRHGGRCSEAVGLRSGTSTSWMGLHRR